MPVQTSDLCAGKGIFVESALSLRLLQLPLLALAAAVLLWAAPASANTFSFGSSSLFSTNNNGTGGNNSDQNTTQTSSAGGTSANFRAQASADIGALTSAIIDRTYTWRVPYTITRTVTTDACCDPAGPAEYVVPLQNVSFSISFSGAVAVDEFGGFEGAFMDFPSTTVRSLGGLFGSVDLGGSVTRSNSNGATPVNRGANRSYNTSLNQSGAALGEVDFAFQLPTDYRGWVDNTQPYALGNPASPDALNLVQSFTDTLEVSFRVRAASRTSGSISTTAGEALACAGLNSQLGSFDLDNNTNCGSGLTINASIVQNGVQTLVPEPGTLALLAASAVGVAALFGRLRRRDDD